MTPEQQARVVAEAQRWIGTPFHHAARIQGAGVDCVNLLAAVYSAAGIVVEPEFEPYSPAWHLHRSEPRFLLGLRQYGKPVPLASAEPGDVVMFRYGRHAAHAAIVVAWPVVIHAWIEQGSVVMTDVTSGPLANRIDSVWRVEVAL
jgi:NlpC/P60 family putative phage cell wall peptidase